MSASNVELQQELNATKSRLIAAEKCLYDLSSKFAYYHTANRVIFSIISRLQTDRKTGKPSGLADLIAFNHNWSGGFDIVENVPLFVLDETIPEDEQSKNEHWTPLIEISQVTEEALIAFDESRPDSEKELDSTHTKQLFKSVKASKK